MADFPNQPQRPQIPFPPTPNIHSLSIQGSNLLESTQASEAKRAKEAGFAHILYERLMKQIQDFEAELDPNEEIAAYLSSFGDKILIQIEEVRYDNPFLIIFCGYGEDRRKVRLVQHTAQLNVLFTSVPLRTEENRRARRIGFCPGTEQ